MTRRYTLLGGFVALAAMAVYAILEALAPRIPAGIAMIAGLGLGCLAGWMVSRRDERDTRRLQRIIEALTERDYAARARLTRAGRLGDLARAVDALGERLLASDQKKRSRKDRLQTILDAMAEAVMVTDGDGRITLTNAVLTNLVGSDPEGKTAVEALRHPDFHVAIEQAQKGFSSLLEIELDGPRGSARRVLRASVSPLRQQRGVVTVFHDVTTERAADRVRRDFVANAGHELRTPLTAIRGFAETLRQGAIDEPESAEEFLDVILRHTQRLQALVDDLADLSRLEEKELRFDLQPVAAGTLLDEVVRGLESQSSARQLTVVCEGLQTAPRVLADERALEQVLVNLVDNAIKYTPPGGEIQGKIEPFGDDVIIEIANSGPGIPAKHLPRVFERFYRVDAGRSRELGGTGLGLSIVKHLVAKLDGEITVDSGGGWTRFRVRLARGDRPKSDTRVSPA